MMKARIGAILALATLTAACGATSTSSSSASSHQGASPTVHLPPSQLLSDASAKLATVTSFRYDGVGTITGNGQTVNFTTSGAVSEAAHLAELTVASHGLTVTEILDSTDFYLHVPTIATPSATSRRWLEVPFSVLPAPIPRNSKQRFLSLLRSMAHPTVVGQAIVDGQRCTLVRSTISGQQVASALGAVDPSASSQVTGLLASTSAVATAAVNEADQLVQLKEQVSSSVVVMHLVLTFTDENQPVSITLPPASEVELISSPSELSGILGQGTGTQSPLG
jgi:hypothetical protein